MVSRWLVYKIFGDGCSGKDDRGVTEDIGRPLQRSLIMSQTSTGLNMTGREKVIEEMPSERPPKVEFRHVHSGPRSSLISEPSV